MATELAHEKELLGRSNPRGDDRAYRSMLAGMKPRSKEKKTFVDSAANQPSLSPKQPRAKASSFVGSPAPQEEQQVRSSSFSSHNPNVRSNFRPTSPDDEESAKTGKQSYKEFSYAPVQKTTEPSYLKQQNKRTITKQSSIEHAPLPSQPSTESAGSVGKIRSMFDAQANKENNDSVSRRPRRPMSAAFPDEPAKTATTRRPASGVFDRTQVKTTFGSRSSVIKEKKGFFGTPPPARKLEDLIKQDEEKSEDHILKEDTLVNGSVSPVKKDKTDANSNVHSFVAPKPTTTSPKTSPSPKTSVVSPATSVSVDKYLSSDDTDSSVPDSSQISKPMDLSKYVSSDSDVTNSSPPTAPRKMSVEGDRRRSSSGSEIPYNPKKGMQGILARKPSEFEFDEESIVPIGSTKIDIFSLLSSGNEDESSTSSSPTPASEDHTSSYSSSYVDPVAKKSADMEVERLKRKQKEIEVISHKAYKRKSLSERLSVLGKEEDDGSDYIFAPSVDKEEMSDSGKESEVDGAAPVTLDKYFDTSSSADVEMSSEPPSVSVDATMPEVNSSLPSANDKGTTVVDQVEETISVEVAVEAECTPDLEEINDPIKKAELLLRRELAGTSVDIDDVPLDTSTGESPEFKSAVERFDEFISKETDNIVVNSNASVDTTVIDNASNIKVPISNDLSLDTSIEQSDRVSDVKESINLESEKSIDLLPSLNVTTASVSEPVLTLDGGDLLAKESETDLIVKEEDSVASQVSTVDVEPDITVSSCEIKSPSIASEPTMIAIEKSSDLSEALVSEVGSIVTEEVVCEAESVSDESEPSAIVELNVSEAPVDVQISSKHLVEETITGSIVSDVEQAPVSDMIESIAPNIEIQTSSLKSDIVTKEELPSTSFNDVKSSKEIESSLSETDTETDGPVSSVHDNVGSVSPETSLRSSLHLEATTTLMDSILEHIHNTSIDDDENEYVSAIRNDPSMISAIKVEAAGAAQTPSTANQMKNDSSLSSTSVNGEVSVPSNVHKSSPSANVPDSESEQSSIGRSDSQKSNSSMESSSSTISAYDFCLPPPPAKSSLRKSAHGDRGRVSLNTSFFFNLELTKMRVFYFLLEGR